MFKLLIKDKHYQWINSLLIAVSSVLLCKETYIVADIKSNGPAIYIIVFFSTLYAYLYYPGEKLFISWKEWNKFKRALSIPYLLPIVFLAILGSFVSIQSFSIFIAIAILALLYYDNVFPGSVFRIRKIYFAKTILLALVWSAATVLLPVSVAGENIFGSSVLFVFARRFFFIAALTIPFEIRDKHKDAEVGDKSFVNLIGIRNSKILAVCLLCIFLLFAIIQYKMRAIDWRLATAMLISFLLSTVLIFIYDTNKKKGNLILFCIDAMLMVQFFLIVAAKGFQQ